MLEFIPEKYIVAFVTILITYLQSTTNFYILGPALGGWFSTRSLKILAPMNILLISIYVNYYLACTTSPGSVPEEWEPPQSVLEDDRVLPVGILGPRFCKKCERYKPPRAHHCKHCGQCVLRMDHHCPWIGNCVGFGNYSHFIRFVFSAIGCCTYGGYLLLWRLQRIVDAWNNRWLVQQPSTQEIGIVILNLVMIGMVILLVGVLAVYHTFCLFQGQTTIEGWERTKTRRMIRRRKIERVEFPFDVGFYKNICSVLGNNPLLWFWPQPTPGDGIHYAVKPNTDPMIIYSWPPRDPKKLGDATIEANNEEWDGPKLVRRDSEGYLVREITMDDRMRMLETDYIENERDPLEQEAHEQLLNDYYDSEQEQDEEYYADEQEFYNDEREPEGFLNDEDSSSNESSSEIAA